MPCEKQRIHLAMPITRSSNFNITKKEAAQLLRENPDDVWGDYKDADQNTSINRINEKLRDEEIPEVDKAILGWRMPEAMTKPPKAFNQHADTSRRAESSEAGSTSNNTLNHDDVLVHDNTGAHEFYDAVRDEIKSER
ncbi:hypothetical protein GQ44DRAFT_726953 [Phaeosphaeriaceae sp. PMI808]|nr:hypothetical protein GQ44DRAFT_726953 [Phaeosphaeriaceae sp. PMI808]